MMEQREFRMPATGEGWRHYKQGPSLYTIIGLTIHDLTGDVMVAYTHYGWSLTQLPAIYVRPLADFLAIVDTGEPDSIHPGKTRKVPRFRFEREAGGDKNCPFIHPVTGTGFRKDGE